MTNYWLIRSQNAAVEGPFTGAQLRQLARDGSIHSESLIADDSGRWVAAGRVKGLFPPPRGGVDPAEPAAATFPPSREESDSRTYGLEAPPGSSAPPVLPSFAPAAAAQSAFGQARPNEYGYVEVGRIRNVLWYLAASIALTAFGLVTIAVNAYESAKSTTPWWEAVDEPWMLSDTLSCMGVLGYLSLWACWVAWLYNVHDDVKRFTQGGYAISPGKAVGLCFIPIFNLFWQVYAPYKLAQFVESCLRQAAQRDSAPRPNTAWAGVYPIASISTAVTPGTVLAFQIVGLIPGCLVGGCRTLFCGLTMRHIQNGLNQMWEGQPKP